MAEDSVEEKPVESPVEPKITGPTAIVIRGRHGGVREVLKNEKGQFVKKPRGMPETREVTRIIRNILHAPLARADGTIDRKGKKAIELMVNNLIEIATYGGKDPKGMMASVQAFEALMLRAHGKPKANEEELEAMQLSGVKYVVIQAPDNMMNPNVVNADAPKEPLKPSFIDAEVVTREE